MKIEEQHSSFLSLRKNVIDFLGLDKKAKTEFGLGWFDLKLYRLTKFGTKTKNLDISTHQQLELEFTLVTCFR